jgi:hypothetical protein
MGFLTSAHGPLVDDFVTPRRARAVGRERVSDEKTTSHEEAVCQSATNPAALWLPSQ